MAVTVTTDNYTQLSACDLTSSGGTWTGGNAITVETDFYQFTDGVAATPACVAYTIRQVTTYQLDFAPTTAVDLTAGSGIVRMWFFSFQQFASQASGGIRFYIDDGTNTAYWNVLGGDTYPGGWYMIAVDTSTTQDSGTKPTMTVLLKTALTLPTSSLWVSILIYPVRPMNHSRFFIFGKFSTVILPCFKIVRFFHINSLIKSVTLDGRTPALVIFKL